MLRHDQRGAWHSGDLWALWFCPSQDGGWRAGLRMLPARVDGDGWPAVQAVLPSSSQSPQEAYRKGLSFQPEQSTALLSYKA